MSPTKLHHRCENKQGVSFTGSVFKHGLDMRLYLLRLDTVSSQGVVDDEEVAHQRQRQRSVDAKMIGEVTHQHRDSCGAHNSLDQQSSSASSQRT